jgi:hypothetical protein
MLIYVLRWWPSWISDRHKKQKLWRGPETTNMIKAKLYMNVHWMVIYKLYVFCFDMKFKMAAMAGLSLTLDPMGKMFQNVSSLEDLPMIITGLFGFNCPSGFREEAF